MATLVNTMYALMLDWSIDSFLTNLVGKLKTWGNLIMILVGVVMVIAAVWQIGTGLMSNGKKQINWVVSIALLLLGGALASFGLSGNGAWNWVSGIAEGGKTTIDELGGTTTPGSTIMLLTRFIWPT